LKKWGKMGDRNIGKGAKTQNKAVAVNGGGYGGYHTKRASRARNKTKRGEKTPGREKGKGVSIIKSSKRSNTLRGGEKKR